MKYYNVIIEGGTEISHDGPYDSPEERDKEAKKLWEELRRDISNNIFRAEVADNGELSLGVFIQGELDE